MWTLQTCDIYRDGGSYGATLMDGERVVSLWLQVGPWDRSAERHYKALFVSQGDRPDAQQELVALGEPERGWLRELEQVDRASASPAACSRLDELLAELRRRCLAPTA